MHRVVAEFDTGGVVADKVRHLQHIARICVGINTTGSNGAVSGTRVRTLMRHRVARHTRIGSTTAIGKEVRAHRGTIERHGGRGAGPGGNRNRLILINRLAHGDDFDIPGLGPHAVDRGHHQAVTLLGRRRAGAVRRGPGNVAALIVAEEARVDILG